MFDYTVTSSKAVSDAVADLKQTLSSVQFGVLWELDVPQKLREKGVEFLTPFHILEVCNPVHAKHALEANMQVGYFLPCKIVVFLAEGQTRIGMMRPTEIVAMLQAPELAGFAEQVERELIKAIDLAK